MWEKVLYAIIAGIMLWLMYTSLKNNPEALSKSNFSKSATTLGLLALVLIAFVLLLVQFVK